MLTFRNVDTGKVIEVPEPNDEPTRGREKQRARRITKLRKMKDWQLVGDADELEAAFFVAGAGGDDGQGDGSDQGDSGDTSSSDADEAAKLTGDDVDPAAVRAWAREQGIEVPERGRLPFALIDQYRAAHGD